MPAWTSTHGLAWLATVAALLGLAAAAADGERALVVLVGVGLVFVVGFALAFDPWVGTLGGLAAAAAMIGVEQVSGLWTSDRFPFAVIEVGGFLVAGWAAGAAGSRIADLVDEARRADDDEGAYGSLGLLNAEQAMFRLEEEVQRALTHGRPLAVASLETEILAPLSEAARTSALRAVARLGESLLRDTDVPFALGTDRIGAILPETDLEDAWNAMATLIQGASSATFSTPPDNERHALGDVATIHVGVSVLRVHGMTAAELLAAALEGAQADRGAPDA